VMKRRHEGGMERGTGLTGLAGRSDQFGDSHWSSPNLYGFGDESRNATISSPLRSRSTLPARAG
jgi:hypothetical protein